jgi:hypothetical protein
VELDALSSDHRQQIRVACVQQQPRGQENRCRQAKQKHDRSLLERAHQQHNYIPHLLENQ